MILDKKNYLIISTAAFHKGLRKQVLAELSFPEKYQGRIRFKVKYLKNSDIFDLIKKAKNKSAEKKKLKDYECIYLFVNLHTVPHGYVPLRYCKILDVILPEKEFADNDFVEFIIEFGQYICLKQGAEIQKNLEEDIEEFIKHEDRKYNYNDINCEKVEVEGNICPKKIPKELPKIENTFVFSMPRKIIGKYLDTSKERSSSKRWREIINYLSCNVHIELEEFYNKYYPCRSKTPASFRNCLFYRWDIYKAVKGEIIEPINGRYTLRSNTLYEIKFETYVPRFNTKKYEARKTTIGFKEDTCITPISGKEVIFSFSQVADQQVFTFRTNKNLTKTQDILHVKSAKEECLVFEPDFKIDITIRRYPSYVLVKSVVLLAAALAAIVAIVEKTKLDPWAIWLLSFASFFALIMVIYEFIDSGLKD